MKTESKTCICIRGNTSDINRSDKPLTQVPASTVCENGERNEEYSGILTHSLQKSDNRQRVFQIVQNIFNILNSNGKPNQIGANTGIFQLFVA